MIRTSLTEWRFPFSAMGSPCELRLYAADEAQGHRVAELGQAEVIRLERRYTRYRDDSVTARINASAGGEAVAVDEETARLLDYAQTAFEQSGGLFDITSGVYRRVWDFRSTRLPDQPAIDALRPFVGWDRVEWSAPNIRLPRQGMEIDFGGYVKEYAADAVAGVCREAGVEHGLVDLGGDIRVIGPHPDGSAWRVGIRNPRSPEEPIAGLGMVSGGMASSGDYERYMEVDGRRYCHILNPKTGWPVRGLASVTVAAPLCILAGTASTIAMLKGQEDGPGWLKELGLPHFWVAEDGETGGDAQVRNSIQAYGPLPGSSSQGTL